MPLDQQRIRSEKNSEVDSLADLGDTTGTNGAATLTDGEAEAGLHSDGLDQLNGDLGGVARHDHVGALGGG